MLRIFARQIANLYDFICDFIYCGVYLQRNVERADSIIGQTSSQSCRYFILQAIFKNIPVDSSYHLLEVGCGQGRVLAYLLRRYRDWDLTGIDSNNRALEVCRKWSQGTKVNVIEKDVFDYNISNFDLFFLGHPFDDDHLLRFIKKIEDEVNHKVYVIIVLNNNSREKIEKRSCWSLVKQQLINRYFGLPILPDKNTFSIYLYIPINNENNKRSI